MNYSDLFKVAKEYCELTKTATSYAELKVGQKWIHKGALGNMSNPGENCIVEILVIGQPKEHDGEEEIPVKVKLLDKDDSYTEQNIGWTYADRLIQQVIHASLNNKLLKLAQQFYSLADFDIRDKLPELYFLITQDVLINFYINKLGFKSFRGSMNDVVVDFCERNNLDSVQILSLVSDNPELWEKLIKRGLLAHEGLKSELDKSETEFIVEMLANSIVEMLKDLKGVMLNVN